MQTNKNFSTKQKKAKSEARYKWILRKQAVNERYWSNCERLSDLPLRTPYYTWYYMSN